MTARQKIHQTAMHYRKLCEARMVEGYKRTVQEQGVFLKQMTPGQLLFGAEHNLNQLRVATEEGKLDLKQVWKLMTAAADVCNYTMTLAERLTENEDETPQQAASAQG